MIGNVGGARPADYDRNGTNQSKTYANQAGIHGATSRWIYTVPSGKKARISAMLVEQARNVAGGVVGVVAVYIYATPFGGTATIVCRCRKLDNVVGAQDRNNTGFMGYVFAGDAVEGVTEDGSTTVSSHTYVLSAILTEFDA